MSVIVQYVLEHVSWWETHLLHTWPSMSLHSSNHEKLQVGSFLDLKGSAILAALCLNLTENKMGIRCVWWFQHETVPRFNAKYKTEKKGNAFAKGSPPHGLWLAPKLSDKEPQRWHGPSTSTKQMPWAKGGKNLGLHENYFFNYY